ncbi:sensor histidine kinase [Streptosporangium sandarakinum]|uniref:sensor histidine kinase n=1 Tax=Streptosporangium sandarakinum TaxID=1260955 RepID=UPI00342A0BD5
MKRMGRPDRRELVTILLLCLPAVLAPALPDWWEPVTVWAQLGTTAAEVTVICAAVLASRRAPVLAMLAVLVAGTWNVSEGAASFQFWGLGLPSFKVLPLNGLTLAAMVLSHRAGRRAPDPRPALRAFAALLGTGAAVVLALSLLGGPRPVPAITAFWLPALSGVLLSGLLPWSVGLLFRQRAEQRLRERRLAAGQARLRERNRITQDMHDSIGHDLALIALRAAALEMAPDLPVRHRRAAGELREAAADTTERLHRIIGVLREDDPAPLTPPEESVSDVVERAVASGMRVELRGDGSLRDPTARRVVQESLTNAAKHAPGAPVTVEVLGGPAGITVEVTNPAPRATMGRARGGPSGPSGPSGGMGLAGLRERVRLADGVFEAGPRNGGFRVTAGLPRPERSGPERSGPERSGPERPGAEWPRAERSGRSGAEVTREEGPRSPGETGEDMDVNVDVTMDVADGTR